MHRDLKPSNAILADGGGVKLLDFGLAKLLRSGEPRLPSATEYGPERAPGRAVVTLAAGQPLAATQPAIETSRSPGSPSGRAAAVLPLAETQPVDFGAVVSVAAPTLPAGTTGFKVGRGGAFTQGAQRALDGRDTFTSAVRGTPLYMAPEIWRGEPATFRSDVYSMGVLLYELCAGDPPHADIAPLELPSCVMTTDVRPLREVVPDVDARFAAVVDRCLQRDPAARYASGQELSAALEEVRAHDSRSPVPPGNPYRGLQPFDAEHRGLFFGRQIEIGSVIERLRSEPLLVITADSGMGKTSLCQAGVLPLVAQGVLDTERNWSVVRMAPGAHPCAELNVALTKILGDAAGPLEPLLDDPPALGRRLRQHLGDRRGMLLFVDQLEELLTQSDAAEKEIFSAVLAQLTTIPGVRLLVALRSDYLSRAEALAGLGERLPPALYFLRPLSPEQLREAIVAPAQLKGVNFESEALLQDLISVTHRSEGGLPLLQFALTALWEARQGGVISVQSLLSIGGVSGALSRYADQQLLSMPETQRRAARNILVALVSPEGGRAQLSADRLTVDPAARAALQALVTGRLIIARDTVDGTVFELAHQALLTSWATLRRWLNESAGIQAALQRLATATTEWLRLGRAPEALWSGRRLADARQLETLELSAAERTFLRASHKAVRRQTLLLAGLLLTVPILLGLTYLGVHIKAERDLKRRIAALMQEGMALQRTAATQEIQVEQLRRQAFTAFDSGRTQEGELLWVQARQLANKADRGLANAGYLLEDAAMLDGSRTDARDIVGDIFYARALIAERDNLGPRIEVLMQRLGVFDASGERLRRWNAPARLSLHSNPPAAQVQLQQLAGELADPAMPVRNLGVTPLPEVTLKPGSYVLIVTAAGRAPVRYPLLLKRAEDLHLNLELPEESAVPPGFVYVPPGRFLFGSAEQETLRRSFLTTVPQHEVTTEAYLIAQYETTYADWLAFLDDLPPIARASHALYLGKGGFTGAAKLTELLGGGWELTFQPVSQVYRVRTGEPLVYSSRERRITQDWLRLPVSGISRQDAAAYVDWLARTGRVPGARLCTEREWERAARGADGRIYPSGAELAPGAANFDETMGHDLNLVGPREIGSYPASRSPLGVDDLAGNVVEWTTSALSPSENVVRGGGYSFKGFACRATNRLVVDDNFRDSALGLRVCATYKSAR